MVDIAVLACGVVGEIVVRFRLYNKLHHMAEFDI